MLLILMVQQLLLAVLMELKQLVRTALILMLQDQALEQMYLLIQFPMEQLLQQQR